MAPKKIISSGRIPPYTTRPADVRRTRSTTGSLPESSANAERARSILNQPIAQEAQGQPSEPERSQVQETQPTVDSEVEKKDGNGDQETFVERTQDQTLPENLTAIPSEKTQDTHQHLSTGETQALLQATPLEVQSSVRAICAEESTNYNTRLDELTNRLDSCLADKQDGQDILKNLATAVANIKTHLECDGKRSDGPVESLVQSVRILREDVNVLLERRKKEDPNRDNTPKGAEQVQEYPERQHQRQPPLTWNQVLEAQENEQINQDIRQATPEEEFTVKEEQHSKSEARQSATSSRRKKKITGSKRTTGSKKTTSRVTRRDDSSSSSSSDEESGEEDYFIMEDSSEEEGDQHVTFAERKKGPRHMGLSTIKPSNSIFDRLMNYRYYRLKDVRTKRSLTATQAVKKFGKSLEVTFKMKFDGTDPMMILTFLTRFVEEADILNMNEGQAYLLLPRFMNDPAESQLRAMRSGACSGGISCWPELVQYLLSTYSTPSGMREALNVVRTLQQRAGEDEVEYGARVNQAASKCGNAFTEEAKMTYFIDGLHPTIQSIVSSWRESQSRKKMTFSKLMLKARDEGIAYRARTSNLRVVRAVKTSGSRNVQFVEPTSGKSSSHNVPEEGDDQLYYIAEDSIPTSDLPSTIDEVEQQQAPEGEGMQLMYAENGRQIGNNSKTVHPLKLAYAGRSATPNRVGWIDKPSIAKNALVCHSCYEKADHISPQCGLGLNEIDKVVVNYEALTESEKSRVPDKAYKAVKAFIVQRDAEIIDAKVASPPDQSKN